MKTKKPNAELVCKQIEDLLVPRLRLSVIDRAIYSHLLRHSRLEGKLRIRFSVRWLAHGTRLSVGSTRQGLRRLFAQDVLRLIERSKAGHVIEVRLPDEILPAAVDALQIEPKDSAPLPSADNLEEIDFLQTKALRQSIHQRENGRCFYCLRRLTSEVRCLDHVVPQAALGRNSYRNLVSCCLECNSQKRDKPAPDFLRWLFRERRLTSVELAERLLALDALAAGKLPPPIVSPAEPLLRKGRPPLQPMPF